MVSWKKKASHVRVEVNACGFRQELTLAQECFTEHEEQRVTSTEKFRK
jgi:hypothetical protein